MDIIDRAATLAVVPIYATSVLGCVALAVPELIYVKMRRTLRAFR